MENHQIEGLDRKTTFVILGSSFVLVAWSMFSSYVAAGPVTASIITYGLYGFYWLYAVLNRNPLIKRLVIFGTVAGLLELVTDHYLVSTIDSLVYPGKELMIWSSPAYMPFAWSNVLLQLSFIGILFTRRFNLPVASILLCIAGGMYIPLYEHLAKGAGWWWYNDNVTMLFNAPVYIIVCEALISFSLPTLTRYMSHHSISKAIGIGVAEGVWILISAIFSFAIAQ